MKSRDGQARKLSVYSKRLKILITIAYFAIASLVHWRMRPIRSLKKDVLKAVYYLYQIIQVYVEFIVNA